MKKETQGPPQLLGMNIGCRTAVILTPWDMSCGWDEHSHEHGSRLIPGDATRLGINIVSYVAGEKQLGEAQSVTREVQAPADRPRQQFTLAQLRHQGDWDPDPNSVYQWLRHVAADSSLSVGFDLKFIDPNESQLAPYPFVYLTGHRDPKLSDEQVNALRRHLAVGGLPVHQQLLRPERVRPARPRPGRPALPRPEARRGAGRAPAPAVVLHASPRAATAPAARRGPSSWRGSRSRTGSSWSTPRTTPSPSSSRSATRSATATTPRPASGSGVNIVAYALQN